MIGEPVDAHQHFWRLARGDYGWLTADHGRIYRDYGLADLRPHLARCGIARTILVQAAPTEAETRFLLDLARESDSLVAGVVGWLDMEARQAPAAIESLGREPLLVGLRPMIQDIPDPDWMLQPRLEPAFRAIAESRLCFDALVKPIHLPNLRRLLDRHPDLRTVIDHAGKPEIAGAGFQDWACHMTALARASQAVVKLSGLVTEAAPDWTPAALQPYIDHLVEAFGPSRLMWGSDWPVVELRASYEDWFETAIALLGGLDPENRAQILGGTARAFYRLVERPPTTGRSSARSHGPR